MRVLVNEQNIDEYGLDTLTGNSKEDLLARAEEANESDYELHVVIPDPEEE